MKIALLTAKKGSIKSNFPPLRRKTMFKEEMIKVYARIIAYSLKKFAIEQEYELDNASATAFSESCAVELYDRIFETSGKDRTKGTHNLLG